LATFLWDQWFCPALYATARTLLIKLSTSLVSEVDCFDRLAAAFSTPAAARPVSFAAELTLALGGVMPDVRSC